jgi:membrane-associated phospholipid phosphatase
VSERRWIGLLALGAAVFFGVDTYLVSVGPRPAFDLPVARYVQSMPWGPLTYVFDLINSIAGWVQLVAAVVLVGIVLLLNRRDGALMVLASIASLLDNVLKSVIARERPAADLVHIVTPAGGYSYPSGHAVFFTWVSFMLAFTIASRLSSQWRWVPWIVAGIVIALACTARVWAGDHWPTDVAGGFLLGLGWSAAMIWTVVPRPGGIKKTSGGKRT